jgi:hypothetical protein
MVASAAQQTARLLEVAHCEPKMLVATQRRPQFVLATGTFAAPSIKTLGKCSMCA